MSRTMTSLTLALFINAGVIVWAHTIELFYFSGFLSVLDIFWGRIVTFDFVACLLVVGVWIHLLHRPEERVKKALPWTIAILALGTPIVLIFFILRSRRYTTAKDVFLSADT